MEGPLVMHTTRTRFAVIAVLAASAAIIGLLSEPARADGRHSHHLRTVTIEATDFAFEAPRTIPAGLVKLRVVNRGAETHQAALIRLKGDKTIADFLGAAAGTFSSTADVAAFVAGPNSAAPGRTTTVLTKLQPGRYGLLCLIPSPDGTPHVVKGMQAELTVNGRASRRRLPRRPVARLQDFSFQVPKRLRAGTALTVENRGSEPHEMAIVRLQPGRTVKDLIEWDHPIFTPEPYPQPADDIGGTTTISPGGRAQVRLPHRKGRYVLVCYVPTDDGKAHFTIGMTKRIRVT